ncbi:MAG: ATP-binding protein [Myxococcota bacterium]|nr:ATP-binding protein [Myxococcota bacterium]
MSETRKMPFRIVITGGPCGGKTTCMARLVEEFTERGFRVYVIPEVPSILLGAGVDLGSLDRDGFLSFERNLIGLQLTMEETFIDLGRRSAEPCIILCDRGTMDPAAYVDAEMWQAILDAEGWSESTLCHERYDAVIHLVSAAIGAESFYTTENNAVRLETPAQAADLDRKVEAAWANHRNRHVIDNRTDFRRKIDRVVSTIDALVQGTESIDLT